MKVSYKTAILAVALVVLVLGAAISAREKGYLKPGDKTGGIHNLVLIYVHPRERWSPEDFLPYVAYLDENYTIKDVFFDGFLILSQLTPYGRTFMECLGWNKPSFKEDWDWLFERYFGEIQVLYNLSVAVSIVSETLGKEITAKVVLMIPYPDPTVRSFGIINGKNLDFQNDIDRYEAVKWFIDRCLALWREFSPKNLKLVGFYWMRETIPGSDVWLVKKVNEYIHSKSLLSIWIPFYFAQGISSWSELGFDAVAYQPNYFFYFWAEEDRVKDAAKKARKLGMGIEMEVDDNVIYKKDAYYQRYMKYLEAAIEEGFASGFMAYYQSLKTFLKLCYSADPELRYLYDRTYEISRINWS